MLAITLTELLIGAGVCLVIFFLITVGFAYRLEAKSRTHKFFAGREAMTDEDFCRLVGSESLDKETCSAVRLAVGSQMGRETNALLRPDDPIRALMKLPFDGTDPVMLFTDIEDRLRTTFSRKDMESVLGGEMPPESLTLGELADRIAQHVKAQAPPEAPSETPEKPGGPASWGWHNLLLVIPAVVSAVAGPHPIQLVPLAAAASAWPLSRDRPAPRLIRLAALLLNGGLAGAIVVYGLLAFPLNPTMIIGLLLFLIPAACAAVWNAALACRPTPPRPRVRIVFNAIALAILLLFGVLFVLYMRALQSLPPD
jgi:hypothetical protein